jgi:DNA-binding XRE family transcriptional regulator
MDITSDQAAHLLNIQGGALRQIETNVKPASERLAMRAARLYKVPVEELLAADDPKPDPKKDKDPEPKVEPTAPPPRRNGRDNRRGPRRSADLKAAS